MSLYRVYTPKSRSPKINPIRIDLRAFYVFGSICQIGLHAFSKNSV